MKPESLVSAVVAMPRGWRLWWIAARPRTLSMAVAPVLVGCALAWAESGQMRLLPAALALICAILIQVGTNLLNDAADFERGNDQPDRLGPLRVTAAGWASPRAVRQAAKRVFAAAGLAGLALVWLGGPMILGVGLASLVAGWAYSGGPRPISYTPFGELFVLAFFGVVAVGGTYYLQTGAWSAVALLGGAALGLMAAAVLMVNNYRDLPGDLAVGRRTLAACLGRRGARAAYGLMLWLPFALLPWLAHGPLARPGAWLALAALPAAGAAWRGLRTRRGAALNLVLAQTAQAQFIYALLLAVGVCL